MTTNADKNERTTGAVDSPQFMSSFHRWRIAITSLSSSVPLPLRCDESAKWEQGKIMQPSVSILAKSDGAVELSEKEMKQQAKECKRCEGWRDELIRESESVSFRIPR